MLVCFCHSTFVCPTEILAFNDRIEEFRKINAEVVACSVDSHFTHHAWTNTPRKDGGLGKLTIPLLSDLTRKISQDYGVFLEDLGHALRYLLKSCFITFLLPYKLNTILLTLPFVSFFLSNLVRVKVHKCV